MKTILNGDVTIVINEENTSLVSLVKKDRCNDVYTLKIIDKNNNEILNIDVTKAEKEVIMGKYQQNDCAYSTDQKTN